MIEKLKNNERAYFFLNEEEKVFLQKMDKTKDVIFMDEKGKFQKSYTHRFEDVIVYRLRPDFNEGKDVIYLECETFVNEENEICFFKNDIEHTLFDVFYMKDFIGFIYPQENGGFGEYILKTKLQNNQIVRVLPTKVVFSV